MFFSKTTRFLSTLALLTTTSTAVYAQEAIDTELEELLALDLSELLVTSYSKREEKIIDAPGITTVITQEDIKRYGGNNLYDLIQRLPNISLHGPSFSLQSLIAMRAQTSSGDFSNNHVLTLINGRPIRESFSGGLDKAIYEGFHLDAIDRVEVIRGPGSVLYGSNAFAGVVNIITKDPNENHGHTISGGAGSFGDRHAGATISEQYGDLKIFGFGKYLDREGWAFNAIDLNGVQDEIDYGRFTSSLMMQANYKNWQVTGFTTHLKDEVINIVPTWFSDSQEHIDKRHLVDVQYKHEINEDWDATFNVTYNGFRGELTPFGAPTFSIRKRDNNLLYEATLRGKLFDKVNLVTGTTYEDREMSVPTDPSITSTRWYTGYIQMDYKPWENLKLIVGSQFNKPESVDLNISPRAGVVYHITDRVGVKVLYGEAFRTPYAGEIRENSQFLGLVGNPDLEPETIATVDAQLFYSGPRHWAALTLYQSKQDDTISAVTQLDGSVINLNGGEIDFQGIELEGKFNVFKGWQVTGSVSYQHNEDETGQNDVRHAPNFLAKLGASYINEEHGFSFGIFDTYHSDPARLESYLSGVSVVNPPAEEYHWVTANATFELDKLLKRSFLKGAELTVYGENLFDEAPYFPEIVTKQLNTLPLTGGRAYYGTLTWKF